MIAVEKRKPTTEGQRFQHQTLFHAALAVSDDAVLSIACQLLPWQATAESIVTESPHAAIPL
jgi:hypothetical protein